MKYLITGGCGFLGSNVAARLILIGHDVCLFDNLSRIGAIDNLSWLQTLGKFEFVVGDVRSADDVYQAVSKFGPEVIYHFAGQVAMTTSLVRPGFDFEVNVLGTLNVLEAVRTLKLDCLILYSSTNKVYGDLAHLTYRETSSRYEIVEYPNGLPENIPLDFHSPYGCSKGAADMYLLDYYRTYGVKTIVFRHSSMYGGRQFATSDQGWVGWFCGQAMLQNSSSDHSFTISGNGKQVRDLLFADDMVDLYLAAADHPHLLIGQAFNIGGGLRNSLSILELFDRLSRKLAMEITYQTIDPRFSDQRVFIADLEKINRLLSWFPVVDVDDGLEKMINWIREIRINE